MPDEPLSDADRDLAAIAASTTAGDPLLADLANLAEASASSVVGLLLNGMVVFGGLASMRVMAEQIDEHFGKVARASLANLESPSDEERENLQALATLATSKVDAFEKWRAETRDAAGPYLNDHGFAFEDAPASLSRRVLVEETRHFLTLVDAQIIAPGQPAPTRVPALRVALSQISGWWIVPLDESGSASLRLWSDAANQH